MRITSKVFTDLAIWMVAFGIFIGVIFPPFITVMGVPASMVLTPSFFICCIVAGILVAVVNIILARGVVSKRLSIMAERMSQVEKHIKRFGNQTTGFDCSPDDCFIVVDSDDEIGQAAHAFNSLISALAHSMETQTSVYSFTEILADQRELELLTRHALSKLLELTHADAGALLLEEGGAVTLAAVQGIATSVNLVENDYVRQGLRTGLRRKIKLPDDLLLDAVVTSFRPQEIIVDPISYKGVPLGVVVLVSSEGFVERADLYLDLLQNSMALAINNSQAHERLQRLAAIDPLTSLYNRRFGMARFHEEYTRAVRLGAPLGVMMCDIDHFKSINDTYGHMIGDKVLMRVAQLIRANMREGDLVLRYGGEEFVAILPAASKHDTQILGERLRRTTEEMEIKDGDQIIRVTISIGVSSYPECEVEHEDDLIKIADTAMYQAKQSGRNKVVCS